MSSVVVLEWKFSPPDYFEKPTEVKLDYTTIIIDNGNAEARIDSAIYDPSKRAALRDALTDEFLGFQVNNHKAYDLPSPTVTIVHPDGRKDYSLEIESTQTETIPHSIDFIRTIHTTEGGIVVEDPQRDRIEKSKGIAALIRKHHDDEVLRLLLINNDASMRNPNYELVHLYKIRDDLKEKFGGNKKEAIDALKISEDWNPKDWDRLGKLCNGLPLRQGRHGGKKYEELRDASDAELSDARRIAKVMIKAYLQYLDMTAPK